jgi:hypothetical protein
MIGTAPVRVPCNGDRLTAPGPTRSAERQLAGPLTAVDLPF